ncbi:MAG: esterase/lipase-like protein [Fibrobacteres bacterium]|nr:esterase/lipase-like protein [Fibrobacterota bacterium]
MKRFGKIAWAGAGLALLTLGACQINKADCDLECQKGFWLDSGLNPDPCSNPLDSTCLVSHRFPTPSDSDKAAKHVIIAVHGFTASTYEWEEFKGFAEDTVNGHGRSLISLVLLGGHGTNLDAFQSSSWKDWGKPILTEYDTLVKQGYQNISFACASTGCALLMQYIADGQLATGPAPKWFFLIDPIVVPSEKLLSLVDLVGPILGNSPNPGSDEENRHWYVNRPQEDLKELYTLVNRVKNQLESGFELPKNTNAKVYKSLHDQSADPVGALLIYKGMRKSDGSHIEAEMLDSRLHVVTRLKGRDPEPSAADSALQLRVFKEMIDKSLAKP